MLRISLSSILLIALLWAPVSQADGLSRRANVTRVRLQRRALESALIRRPLRPDLQILQVLIHEDHTPLFDYGRVEVWVRNAGSVPSQAFLVAALFSRDGRQEIPAMKAMSGLAPGESRMIKLDLSAQGGGLVEWYELTVEVDRPLSTNQPTGAVLESNEQNNTAGPFGFYM